MGFKEKLKMSARKFSKGVDSAFEKGKKVYASVEKAGKEYELKQQQFRAKQDARLDAKIKVEEEKAMMRKKKLKLQQLRQQNRGSSGSLNLNAGFKL